MRRCTGVVAIAAVVAGCSARGDDCKIVLGDPAHAVAEMARRYPDDPVKRAAVIERCVAPDGDDCERLDRIIRAIPDMATGMPRFDTPAAARSPISVRDVCLGMPIEMRRCMLPSYLLGHDAECQAIRAQIAQVAADLHVTPRPGRPDRCDPSDVALYVTTGGVWLGTGPDARCFEPRQHGALGIDWLEAELRPLAAIHCPPAVQLAAAPGVRYRDIIAAMDAAVKVGLVNIDVSDAQTLPVSFAAADPQRAAKHCPATTVKRADAKPSPGRSWRPPDKAALADAPVLIVTPGEVSLGGKPGIRPVGTLAEIARGVGVIDKLREALPPNPQDPTIVLQADQDTDAAVIARLVETANAAGYSNMLFAVKNK